MKIGIDARFYGEAGPGRYVGELLRNLEKIDRENDYLVYLKRSNFHAYEPQNPRFKKELADFNWYGFSEQLLFPFKLYRRNFDLVHFTQINVPLLYFRPFVVTVHDLILHEFSTERGNWLKRLLYRLKKIPYFLVFYHAVNRSRKILVPSQTTKEDLLKHYPIDPNKTRVTYEAVDHYPSSDDVKDQIEVLEKYGIKKPYLLCLASFYPHKNIRRLVEAFKSLKDRRVFGGQLVLVGKESDFSRMLRSWVEQEKIAGVNFPGFLSPQGYLPDSEVEVILANAHVYVQPALKEGFGLPPVEAMVFGVPTIVSDIPAMREMCAEAALYFNPLKVEDLVSQIDRLLIDEPLRDDLVKKGLENVKRFAWVSMAKQTLEVYKKAYARN